jgi:hypothetical protein
MTGSRPIAFLANVVTSPLVALHEAGITTGSRNGKATWSEGNARAPRTDGVELRRWPIRRSDLDMFLSADASTDAS